MSHRSEVDSPSAPLRRWARRLASAAGLYALAGGLVSFGGWLFDVPRLTDWNDAGISIFPNAALAAACAGAALLLLQLERRRAAVVCGALVAAVGATVWLQNVTGVDLGMDRLFLFGRTWGEVGVIVPGRMGPPASSSWILLGLGIVLAARGRRARAFVPMLSITALGISLLSIVGHLYGADRLYALPRLTIIALQTGTFIFAVASGLTLSVEERAPARLLTEAGAAGTLLRRAVWVVVLVPMVLGWLRIVGQQRGAYDPAFGTALRTLAEIILMTGLLFWTAAAIRRQAHLATEKADAARSSEARLTGLLGSMNDGFMIFDRDWRITFVNAEALRRAGLAEADLRGRVLWDAFPPSPDNEDSVRTLRRAMSERTGAEFETFYAPRGRWYFARAYPMSDGGLAIFSRDITERKATERRLREQAHLLDLSAESIFVRDAQNRITYWNRGAESLYGYSRDEAIGRTSDELLKTRFPEPLERIRETLDRGQRWEGELVHTCKDGREVTVASRWVLHDADGGSWILETNNDMTERKQIERERDRLLQAERSARADAERASAIKDEFLATLSHELRTPLNAILGWVRVLEKRSQDPGMVDEGITVIARNAKAQSDLIADLLDMNRIMSGRIRLEMEDLDLAAVAREAVDAIRPAADSKQIRLELVTHPVGEGVRGDPSRVHQILWNLLTNAVKFTPRGGLIQVTLRQEGPVARIEVKDTGTGIAPQLLPHVFDRFRQGDASTTREHGGLGLGLAIVKQLVELHGGAARALSDGDGQGAAFTVEFPLARETARPAALFTIAPEPAEPAPLAGPAEEVDLGGITVLAVDDQPDARELMRIILEARHARVFTAGSADEALGLLAAASPDIILCDIAMPGLDGYGFIRKVRQRDDDTPALAVSAFARTEDRVRALRAGYQGHIAKPVEPAELVSTVALLARAAGGRTGAGSRS
jgi:PAS domain S-box-containing protein